MNWKDYFYFQKRDKTAILLLLVLITLSGGIYFFTRPQERIAERDTPLAATETNTNDNISNNIINDTKPNKKESTNYPYPTKLKVGETIELNAADTTSLKKIPGIGIGFATRIIKYRNLLGGFAGIQQLKEVWGVDDDLYEKVTPYITLIPRMEKIRVNSSDYNTLSKHPYINPRQAKIVIDIRERKGDIESLRRLSLLDEFTEEDLKRLTPYLSFD